MYLGHIVELAEKEELFEDPKHPYTRSLLSAIPVPDPREAGSRTILQGDVPDPVNPPSGCRFHPRCPEAREVCREINPDPRNVSTAGAVHNAACVKHDVFDVDYANSAPIQTDDDEFGEDLQVTEGSR
jgi:peptide/nickel transport system ATP-binding protein